MTQEDKDILLRLLQQHKQLGVSDQIDYEKFYLYSIITHSAFVEMVDKWSIKPSLAEKMVDIMAFVVDKDEITTESIVSHFGYPPLPPSATCVNSQSLATCKHTVETRTERIEGTVSYLNNSYVK